MFMGLTSLMIKENLLDYHVYCKGGNLCKCCNDKIITKSFLMRLDHTL